MGQITGIQWCHHTFNPWRGCMKVSEGCAYCYAETMSYRNPKVLGEWGPTGKRPIAAESYWKQPLTWNRAAERAGERRRVFCLSLGDVFEEREELDELRWRLWGLAASMPYLDWLFLTKRVEAAARWIANDPLPENVWLGASVENQKWADLRIPALVTIPATLRFLSIEPVLGPIDLPTLGGVSWAILGGESSPKARPCDPAWIRQILTQCREAGVACFVKQLGSRPVGLNLADGKGGDPAEWPEDLKVREFPRHGAYDLIYQ